MASEHVPDLSGEAYSTRTCRRCAAPMTPTQTSHGREWKCPMCGRKEH